MTRNGQNAWECTWVLCPVEPTYIQGCPGRTWELYAHTYVPVTPNLKTIFSYCCYMSLWQLSTNCLRGVKLLQIDTTQPEHLKGPISQLSLTSYIWRIYCPFPRLHTNNALHEHLRHQAVKAIWGCCTHSTNWLCCIPFVIAVQLPIAVTSNCHFSFFRHPMCSSLWVTYMANNKKLLLQEMWNTQQSHSL